MKSPKYVYLFEEADGSNKKLLGGKGAGLAEMTRWVFLFHPDLSSPPRPVFMYYENKKKLPEGLMEEIQANLKTVEEKTGKTWEASQPSFRLRPLGRCHLHARHDGYHPQSGSQ